MRLLALSCAVAMLACGSKTPAPIPPPPDTDFCDDAEVHLQQLQCHDRRGDPMWVNRNGEHFQETCRHAQEEGRIFFNPRCVSQAKTCEEANTCPTQ